MKRLIFLLLSLSFAHFAIIRNKEFEFLSCANSTSQEYTAVVLRNGVPVCAGAIISGSSLYSVVVTAAHCVYPVSSNRISVQVNSLQPVAANRVFVYPHYAPPSVDFDIAVIKYKTNTSGTFKEMINYSEVNTATPLTEIPLSETEPKKGDLVKICIRDSNSGQWKFKSENATVENKKICKSMYEGILTVTNRMICAYSSNSGSVGGSPLVFNNTLAGITSKSSSGKLPTIYTSLTNSDIRYFIDGCL